MRDVPFGLRVVGEGSEARATYEWSLATGALYLLKSGQDNLYKFGASVNPAARILHHIRAGRFRFRIELNYVWSIATNGVGRLEKHWKKRWKPYRVDRRHEWVRLPEFEVVAFRAVCSVIWVDIPRPDPEWLECVSGPFTIPA